MKKKFAMDRTIAMGAGICVMLVGATAAILANLALTKNIEGLLNSIVVMGVAAAVTFVVNIIVNCKGNAKPLQMSSAISVLSAAIYLVIGFILNEGMVGNALKIPISIVIGGVLASGVLEIRCSKVRHRRTHYR